MLNKKTLLYCIPGWGFKASIFNTIDSEAFDFIPLDYLNTSCESLPAIATHLAEKISDNAVLLGWSFGGLIAIQLAALFPHKIKALILIATQPRLQAGTNWAGTTQSTMRSFIRECHKNLNKHINHFTKLVCYPNRSFQCRRKIAQHLATDDPASLNNLLSILFNADLREEYKYLHRKVLHFVHENDPVVTATITQIKKLNPHADIIKPPSACHAAYFITPDSYLTKIKYFLQHAH